jgi:hypothetical protein
MDKVEIGQIKLEQSIFTDLWNLYKKYCHCETEADFDGLLAETDRLESKYKGTELNSFFLAMELAVVNQIEKNYKLSKLEKENGNAEK